MIPGQSSNHPSMSFLSVSDKLYLKLVGYLCQYNSRLVFGIAARRNLCKQRSQFTTALIGLMHMRDVLNRVWCIHVGMQT